MIADIESGNYDLADILFLVAAILAIVALIVRAMVRPVPVDGVLMAGAVAAISLGFLVL